LGTFVATKVDLFWGYAAIIPATVASIHLSQSV